MRKTAALRIIQSKPFPIRPGSDVINEFLKHVRETGKPDTWRHHNASRPLPNAEFEDLKDFVVPKEFHETVGKASCPICSPSSPKYFSGFLAWFVEEGVLRAIGNECAKKHFGHEAINAAKAVRRSIERREQAQDYLLATYPRAKSITDEVVKLGPKARVADLVVRKLWNAASKSKCKDLLKRVREGHLAIYDEITTSTTDQFGQVHPERIQTEVSRVEVEGTSVLGLRFSVAALFENTITALHAIENRSDDEALEFVANKLSTDQFLYDAEKLVRNAEDAAQKLTSQIAEVERFFFFKKFGAIGFLVQSSKGEFTGHFQIR